MEEERLRIRLMRVGPHHVINVQQPLVSRTYCEVRMPVLKIHVAKP